MKKTEKTLADAQDRDDNISMTSEERMKSWKALPEPRPAWETWKRILAQNRFDPIAAEAQWDKISEKKMKKSVA